nr:glycosyl hydrolase family 5 [Lachnospiraceae bacterium]
MEKIKGVNLGNWLVLEKWMEPAMFDGVDAEDETWLNRRADKNMLKERMKQHRDTYVEEKDFRFLKEAGITHVRIPVPYFIFGDREPFIGCIEYLDKAFDWAEKYEIKILVDLHTTPGSQNGYDNGGICGVCKWHKQPEEV